MIIIPTEKRFDWSRKPWVLVSLVLLNVLVFFWYQSGDQDKLEQAMETYAPLLPLEWPLYQTYLEQSGDLETLEQAREAHALEPEFSAQFMLLDPDFFQHLSTAMFKAQSYDTATQWLRDREQVNQQVAKLSWIRWGLIPSELKVTRLISHQFLHGDTMHLLGNLFFLLICGFAVEAAIGHWRFLAFYLISGIAGGLMHAMFEADSSIPLVGASGAISGVMAMYLGVFMLRKIEFFYWLFVFVGYFRAPALIILPLYIGKEIFSYLSDPDAGVAFMAHAGGFIVGAGLSLLNNKFSPQTLNNDYIETPDSDPQEDADLIKVLKHIEAYQFEQALRAVNTALKTRPDNFRLHQIRYNLCKIAGGQLMEKAAAGLLGAAPETSADIHTQVQLIRRTPDAVGFVGRDALIALVARLCDEGETQAAEQAYRAAEKRISDSKQLMRLAVKLAQSFAELGQIPKSKEYQQRAHALQEATS
ncbi:rhomboid family intramembrane serine protease [Simiduia agarivorans]|uniref:Integral membrane protein n=1 Tax=Simiduia agarivorans (strain DSM 21679 / JCM 13881 / BCRC 17597 / SA1) TaxID=1117647 RepID=K4KJX3_SIMAS|nr:rhomboid family intramembrane serine protease [Simiduia agarivorans]AFU99459.1 integral membrane protein [Simiduia agarivorans SA1 = DSM 21679]